MLRRYLFYGMGSEPEAGIDRSDCEYVASHDQIHRAETPALYGISRMIGALLIYVVVNTLLKLPFDKDFLAGASLGALIIRMARYAIIMLLIMGVYPSAFPWFERVGNKSER